MDDQWTKSKARQLRAAMTPAERLLWQYLRRKQIDGLRFRRQAPIGRYIVDFVCHERKLIIEVDGGQHGMPENVRSDEERTAFLESEGYSVLRLWNNDVLSNPEGALTVIQNALEKYDGQRPPPEKSS